MNLPESVLDASYVGHELMENVRSAKQGDPVYSSQGEGRYYKPDRTAVNRSR